MSVFRYAARNGEGILRQGELEAESIHEAARFLREQGLWIVRLKAYVPPAFSWKRLLRTSKPEYAVFFLRQLSIMLEEQPLNEVLSALAHQQGEKAYQSMLAEISNAVSLGQTLAEALRPYGYIFSMPVIQLLAAGEQSGSLPEMASRLAVHLEQEYARKQKFQSAMMYPAFLGVASFGAVMIMLFFILPNFLPLFAALHVELPWPTRLFLGLADIVVQYGGWMMGGAVLLASGFFRCYRQEHFRQRVDFWMLKFPGIGSFRSHAAWAHILGTLAVLLKGGMRLDVALGMAVPTTGNHALQAFLRRVQQEVERGYSLTSSLQGIPLFPVMLLELVRAGENSGRLETMLQKSSEYCVLSAEQKANRMQALAEPLMILVLGSIVFLFVLSIILPLLDSMEAIS